MPASPPARNLWQRRISDPIVAQLKQGLTPSKIALTIAIGSSIAMFPIFGTTTLLCLLVGVVMRLNQPIMQVVNYVCTPLHVVFIPFCFYWGERLFSVRHTGLEWRHLRVLLPQSWAEVVEEPGHLFHSLMRIMHDYGGSVLHAIVLWAILVPFWATTIYHVVLPIVRGIHRVRHEAVAKHAAEKTQDHPVP